MDGPAESGVSDVIEIVWTVDPFDCISSRTSSKDQSYTVTAEGTDLSTDMLSMDGG